MSTTTKNYGLVKPELTDAADITATNENWNKVDEKLKSLEDDVNNALPSSGGTMTGTLTMKKVEGMGQGEWYKNHSSSIDSGTVVADKDNTGKVAQIVVRAKDQKVVTKFSDDSLVDKELFGEHNVSFARKSIGIYYSLNEIGVTIGEETIQDIARNLPNYSRLVCTTGSTNNPSIYPNSNYGLLIVEKTGNTRVVFSYITTTGLKWSGLYVINSSIDDTWTGWIMDYNEKSITYGTTDLEAGVTVLSNGKIHFVYE